MRPLDACVTGDSLILRNALTRPRPRWTLVYAGQAPRGEQLVAAGSIPERNALPFCASATAREPTTPRTTTRRVGSQRGQLTVPAQVSGPDTVTIAESEAVSPYIAAPILLPESDMLAERIRRLLQPRAARLSPKLRGLRVGTSCLVLTADYLSVLAGSAVVLFGDVAAWARLGGPGFCRPR
jgi:hypothetical protein